MHWTAHKDSARTTLEQLAEINTFSQKMESVQLYLYTTRFCGIFTCQMKVSSILTVNIVIQSLLFVLINWES